MFDQVTAERPWSWRRVAGLAPFAAGAALLQAGLVAWAVTVNPAPARLAGDGPVVEVRFVKGAPRPPAVPRAPPPRRPPRLAAAGAPKPPAPRIVAPIVAPPTAPAPPALVPAAPPPAPPAEAAPLVGQAPQAAESAAALAGGLAAATAGRRGRPSSERDAGAPREFDATMTAPIFLSGPDPEYTREALEHEVEGQMVVKCTITVEGRVLACRVLRSLPFMARAVVEALQRRAYRPATLDGRPLEVDYTFRLRLALP